MLCDAVLDTVILFSIIQTNDFFVECLDACGCQHIDFMEKQIND